MREPLYLIIGVGNTLRRDDGAGIWLAEAVSRAMAARGSVVETRLLQQLLPEIAEEIYELNPQTVVITDCSAESQEAQEGWVERLVPAEGDVGEEQERGMGSHGLGAAALIELARRLYGFAGDAWLATVPGVDFAHGEGLSPSTRQAIDHLAPVITAHIS